MRKILLLAASIILIILIGLSFYSTSKSPNKDQIQVSFAITRNYGKELIQENKITVASGTSALEALKLIAEVETDYGGGFVSSINGIKSAYPDKRCDWFFYVNGFLAKEGAGSYIVVNGDLIQLDYHGWGSNRLLNAAMGCYPKYFVNGYAGKTSPTVIVFEEEFSEEAAKLKRQLSEKFNISVVTLSIDEISEDEKSRSNVVILAGSNNKLVLEINEIHEKIGFSLFFEENILIELDHKATPCRKYAKAGMIQVTQNIWNPKGNLACENVIMLITGTDTRSIEKCVDIMLQDFSKYRYSFGLIVTEPDVIKIPYCPES